MRVDVATDYDWQRNFIPKMKMIAGLYLIGEAPAEEDAERNTDLVVLKLDAVRIACRVRRQAALHKEGGRYGDQFTIRCWRKSGAKTELHKIVEGWGDYILYGFANETDDDLDAWLLGDLNVFRRWHTQRLMHNNGRPPGERRLNHDGQSALRGYNIHDLPAAFVVARVTARQ